MITILYRECNIIDQVSKEFLFAGHVVVANGGGVPGDSEAGTSVQTWTIMGGGLVAFFFVRGEGENFIRMFLFQMSPFSLQ